MNSPYSLVSLVIQQTFNAFKMPGWLRSTEISKGSSCPQRTQSLTGEGTATDAARESAHGAPVCLEGWDGFTKERLRRGFE